MGWSTLAWVDTLKASRANWSLYCEDGVHSLFKHRIYFTYIILEYLKSYFIYLLTHLTIHITFHFEREKEKGERVKMTGENKND